MPEEQPDKNALHNAVESEDEGRWTNEDIRTRRYRLPGPPASPAEILEGITDLLSYKYKYDEADGEAFEKKIESLPFASRDLAQLIRKAYRDFNLYRALDMTPALALDEATIPVASNTLINDVVGSTELSAAKRSDAIREKFSSVETFRDSFQEWSKTDANRRLLSFKEGVSLLQGHFEKFFSVRVEGSDAAKVSAGGPHAPTLPTNIIDRFTVEVNCCSTGYRILTSPAYFIDWTYFGAPSSPVKSEILPGRYIFGTDSISEHVVSDGAIFRIPYDFSPRLVRF